MKAIAAQAEKLQQEKELEELRKKDLEDREEKRSQFLTGFTASP